MDEAIEAFTYHLKVERNRSDNTIESYARDLRRFATWAEGRGVVDPAAVDRELLSDHLLWLDQQDAGLRSIARARTSLRQLPPLPGEGEARRRRSHRAPFGPGSSRAPLPVVLERGAGRRPARGAEPHRSAGDAGRRDDRAAEYWSRLRVASWSSCRWRPWTARSGS
ncbi:MAG: site-specific integrase [Alphaproteobacteria bacterium]|nr:site-specific integrase [Alphaproteobacteria bacterium]